MKKLINLIALVMLVSTNVLTPISYADVEDFVDNVESIEDEVENIEEQEETLPTVEEILNDNELQGLSGENEIFEDSHDTTSGSVLDEEVENEEEVNQPLDALTESGAEVDYIDGGKSIDEKENIDELGLQEVQESTIMEVVPGSDVTLLPGQQFNSLIKTLANDGETVAYTEVNDNIESFQRVDKIPEGVTTGEISLAGEQYPVYAGFSGGVLYYATKAEIIQLNENSQNMFQNFGALTELDLSDFDTSNVTNMYGIFAGCSKLEGLSLSGWDFSNTSVNMMNMTYGGLPLLKKINMQNTKFSGSLAGAFAGLNKVEELNLSGADTSNVMSMGGLFSSCSSLTGLDLSSWNTSNVTDMGGMFGGCSKLEELNLSGWNFSKSTSTPKNLFGEENGSYCSSSCNLKKLNLTNVKFGQSMNSAFMDFKNLEEIKLDGIDTSDVTDMGYMFKYCSSSLTGLDLSNFDTNNVTNMSQIFAGCYNLKILNLSGWDFTKINANGLIYDFFASSYNSIKKLNVTNTKFSGSMYGTFRRLSNAEEIKLDGIDTSNVTDMNNMFFECRNLTGLDLSDLDTENVTNMSYMFFDCSSIRELDLSNFNTSKVTNMSNMFSSCSSLRSLNLDNWDLSELISYGGMFSSANPLEKVLARNWVIPQRPVTLGCEESQLCADNIEIDVSGWDLSNVKNLSRLFGNSNAKEIKGLDTWNTSNITGMYYMFGNCKLTGLDLSSWDTSSVINMQAMFYGCNNLKTIYTSTGFVTNGVTYSNDMFNNNTNLVGGNGTKYNSSKTDKEYAKIDKPGQKGYFTEKGGDIFVRFMVGGKEYVTQTVQFGGKAIKPSNDPIKTGSQFVGWITKDGEMYDFDTNIKEYAELYAKFSGGNETILLPGYKFNETIKKLSGQSGATYSTTNTSINQIQQWEGSIPEGVMTMVISIEGSENPVYARYDNGTIYYHTEATKIYLNEDSSYMFYCCYGFAELDLSSRDASNVTDMYYMFGYTYLTDLNLSGWDTSNVTNMGNMFYDSYYLTYLNMSGWDFRQVDHGLYDIRYYPFYYGGTLNLTNAKFAGDISWGFYYISNGYGNVEKIILDGADVSEVTNMNALFYGLYDIKELNLSSRDTSNVTDMSYMFDYCNNLETIYVGTGFVTDQVTSSSSMFYDDTKLVGGNGTAYDSSHIDKEYARIDNQSQSGYFTYLITLSFDSNGGTPINSQKFKSGLTGTKPSDPTKIGNTFLWWHIGDDQEFDFSQPIFEPTQLYAKWQVKQYRITFDTDGGNAIDPIDVNYGDNISVPNPTRNGYRFIGWEPSLPATMPAEDLSVKAKWEKNGSSGGGGGGGGGNTKPDTPKDEQQPAEPSQSDASSGTNVKEPETNTGSNIQTGSQVDSSEQTPQNDSNTPMDSSTSSQNDTKTYSTEFQEAYEFAHEKGITTMPTIQKANMEGKLTRIAMAKMLSQYAVNVLGKEPDTSKTVKFKDVTAKTDADYDNGVTLAYQLGIMGQNMPGNKFRPNDEVSRAEFVTALSRLLYNTPDGEYKSTSKYYTHHMEKLEKEGIITNVDPKMKERRGYVMIMLMRSAK